MTASLVLTAPNGQTGEVYNVSAGAGPSFAAVVALGEITLRVSPIYVEDYLAINGGDIRSAIRSAWLSNPLCTWFIYPPGSFPFVGNFLNLVDGFRNGTRHTGQNTEIFRDLGGIAGGQNIFFYRNQIDGTHADSIVFDGAWKLSLYNALTSFFGFALGLESASNCRFEGVECFCSLNPAATQGRIRWGLAMFGGDQVAQPTAGTGNRVDRCTLTIGQLQCCSQGRSQSNMIVSDTIVKGANDFAISCVTSQGFNLQNIQIRNTLCFDVQGTGVIFVGSDGQSLNASLMVNMLIDGVTTCGAQSVPVLTFQPQSTVQAVSAIVTRRLTISNVQGELATTSTQCRNVQVFSCDLETSFTGLELSDLNLGITTTSDPLEALLVLTKTLEGMGVSNVVIEGQRGVKISDCGKLTLSNVVCLDGTITIQAQGRSIVGVDLVNCYAKNTRNFQPGLFFNSTAGFSFDKVHAANCNFVPTNAAAIITQLTGGTMAMMLSNVDAVGNTPSAETLAGIIRASNIRGFAVPTTLNVVVPAVAAGAVGYVNVSMAGTRLSDLVVNEGISANPQAQLVAAGAGGAFVNCRVQAVGSVECAFLGPLAGGNFNFNFYRTN